MQLNETPAGQSRRRRLARPQIQVVDAHGEYFVRVKAANGETLAISETYTRPEDAERGARTLRRTVLLAALRFTRVTR